MKIMHVQTEYLNDPLGIDIEKPRIMWTLEGVTKQEAYEIRFYVNDHETGQSSGIINSPSMHYDLPTPFKSRDAVRFTVRALCDGEWAESEEHSFEMGLLRASDWTAKWIAGDYRPDKKKRYPVDCFKKEFEVSDIKSARLYISALGLYEAHINGNRVGDFVLAPGSTDYRKRVQYQTYDVTALLREGKNELTVFLADGWYRGSIGAKGFTDVFGSVTAFIAQLEVRGRSGGETRIVSDASFSWSDDGPIRFADLKDGEVVDLNCVPSFSGKAREVIKKTPLSASDNTFVREQERFSPARTFITPKGKRIYEFPHNLAGIVAFKVNARQNEQHTIRLGEMLDAEGELTLKNIQCVRKGKCTPLQEVRLTCKEGINEYHGKFTIAGFKYLEVDKDTELMDLKQIALYSGLEETGTFSCDNELINTFVENTKWSLKSNSCDVPTDCPTRERMGWTGDSQVFFNTASFLTEYAAFARKHVRDIFDRQDKNGRLPQIAPYNAEDWFMDAMNGSVGWADAGVLIPYRFYKKYGDDRLLRQYFGQMVKYAKFMIGRCGGAKGIYAIYAKPLHLSKENRK
ncbi:MAG: family 78 glycoside hydrolase catalytic domain, partial [Lachnospiraceae bacterium]|nr:family 78 glycoside hydrolase catalytic domain [Lachnospiraceae bacterium]